MVVKFLLFAALLLVFRLPLSMFGFLFRLFRPVFLVGIGFVAGVYMSQEEPSSPIAPTTLREEPSLMSDDRVLSEGTRLLEAASDWGQMAIENLVAETSDSFNLDFNDLPRSAASLLRSPAPSAPHKMKHR